MDIKIEDLMKPFVDKLKELESEIKQVNRLKLQLEKLRDNKESEINEYISAYVSENPDAHISSIRKDLENAYLAKEEDLQARINNTPDYTNVYVYELSELQDEYRKIIYQEKQKLELEIEEADLRLQIARHSLAAFKYEYDENHRVTNGNKFKELYDYVNKRIDALESLKAKLDKLNQYDKIVRTSPRELLGLDGKETLRTLTNWEREYYEKRKAEKLKSENPSFDNLDVPNNEDKKPELNLEPVKKDLSDTEIADMIVDDYNDLLDSVYDDVVSSVDNMQTLKLSPKSDPLKRILSVVKGNEVKPKAILDLSDGEEDALYLPNGEYVNRRDFEKALKNYYKKNKGKTYQVKATKEKLSLSRRAVRKVKNMFRDCSIIELLRNKKITNADVRRVRIKEDYYVYQDEAREGEVLSDMKLDETSYVDNGEYVLKDDIKECLNELFTAKKTSWLKKLKEKLLSRKQIEENLDPEEFDESKFYAIIKSKIK